MFRSFPLCLCGAGHRQSGATLNGNPKGRTTLKMGFLFTGSYLPRRKFIWSKDLLSPFLVSIIDRELFGFPPIFSFLLSSDLQPGILLFLFFSFFSFLPFRSLFRNSGFSIRYSLSLDEILLSFFFGERRGFSLQAMVQSSLRLYLNMVFSSCVLDFDIWGKTNSCVKVSVSG